MEYYTLQPGHLEIIKGGKPADVLDPLHDFLERMPKCYILLSPLQVKVLRGSGTIVKMEYTPRNKEINPIEVAGNSVDVAELLMRSEIAEAWRRYLVMTESSPHVNGKVQAIGEELSDLIEH